MLRDSPAPVKVPRCCPVHLQPSNAPTWAKNHLPVSAIFFFPPHQNLRSVRRARRSLNPSAPCSLVPSSLQIWVASGSPGEAGNTPVCLRLLWDRLSLPAFLSCLCSGITGAACGSAVVITTCCCPPEARASGLGQRSHGSRVPCPKADPTWFMQLEKKKRKKEKKAQKGILQKIHVWRQPDRAGGVGEGAQRRLCCLAVGRGSVRAALGAPIECPVAGWPRTAPTLFLA